MADDTAQRAAFEFLRPLARENKPFTMDEFIAATGWERSSVATYISKQLKGYITRSGPEYRIKRQFARMSFEQFREITTQVKSPVASYHRGIYDSVVTFEFLLPLTREDKLRSALDELFYRDTLEQLVRDIEPAIIGRVMPRAASEMPDDYIARVVNKIADLIGGYSISHVAGRFRATGIQTRAGAAELMSSRMRYLIDETTAVVRFIIPCPTSRRDHGEEFELGGRRVGPSFEGQRDPTIPAEIELIRTLFFNTFVEAVAWTIRGEDVIWLLEDSPDGRRLYVLETVGS